MNDTTATSRLHPHHPLRFVLIIGFVAMVLLSTDKAGQSEMVRLAAEQAALHSTERAPAVDSISKLAAEERDVSSNIVSSEDHAREAMESVRTPMPSPLRGIYLTGWSAGNANTLHRIENLIEETELNAVIIDIKDASGRLTYQPQDEMLRASGVGTNKIKDLRALTAALHEKGIYIIGRVQVFQDPFYAGLHPEDAFFDMRTGELWRDNKGIAWLRPDREAVWNYLLTIANDAHANGVDEINVDYVRFPSDGPLVYLDMSGMPEGKANTIESFFSYIGTHFHEAGIILSADLFGLTMSAKDDLGIGQKLELIAPHVDIVAPMVYPSHFASGAYGIGDPAAHPYEIIHQSLSRGAARLEAIGESREKLRPWLQDFDLGAIYTPDMVRAQITAAEELSIDSWMLWDPRNSYTKEALTPGPQVGYTGPL